ncbi:hypothetical protein BDB01DRAFT_834469 [Pilobolus umbonatus]|nr:hypothetical protein BDB01DRAFT_834469 [Pilobolus umbonatus]
MCYGKHRVLMTDVPFPPFFLLNMESLPIDILDIIFQHVPRHDQFTCLRVCSYWNTLISRRIYNNIRLKSRFETEKFLEAMALYPHCIKAGRHIKSLEIYLRDVVLGRDSSDVDSVMLDTLVNCPNLEKLKVEGCREIVGFLDLRSLFGRKKCMELLMCYYKFRSSLKRLDLSGVTHILKYWSLDNIIAHISDYTHLNHLKFDLPSSLENDDVSAFNVIIDRFPKLSRIRYKGTSLHIPGYNSQLSEAKSSVSTIHLQLMNSSLKDIYYIRDKFECLSHLKMKVSSTLLNDQEVIDKLMGIKSLVKFDFQIMNCHSKDVLNTFWKHATPPSKTLGHYSRINFDWSDVHISAEAMIFRFFTRDGVRSMSSEVNNDSNIVEQFGLTLEGYIEGHGHYLTALDVVFHETTDVHLNTLNDLCPNLEDIRMEYSVLTLPRNRPVIKPNLNMKALYLNTCLFPIRTKNKILPLFKQIEDAFPMLEHLELEEPDFNDDKLSKFIYEVQLPANLRKIDISKVLEHPASWRGVVMKERDGVHEKTWYESEDTKTDFTKTENVIQELYQKIGRPIVVFKNSNLEYASVYIS